MRPLTYLLVRTLWNGVKRAVTSPLRAVSLVFAAGYYYMLVIHSFVPSPAAPRMLPLAHPLDMPDIGLLHGLLFGIFSFASILMAGGIFNARGGFRAADVDVLFATPVKPEHVLVFRILRDYLFTLLFPLFVALFGWRGASTVFSSFVRNYPTHSLDVFRACWLAWMLMSLAFVSIGYGSSLFVGRSDLRSDQNQRNLTILVNAVLLSALGLIAYRLNANLSVETALSLTNSTYLQIVFLPATLATDLVTGSLQGNLLLVAISAGGLLSTIGLGLALALTQVGWLYDQAAAKGLAAGNSIKLRRSGDFYALAAERVRSGKRGRSRISSRIAQLSTTGPMALVWKDLLLQLRGPLSGALITLTGVLLGYGALGWLSITHPEFARASRTFEIGVPCAVAYLLAAINGYGGFQEMLRRVDLLKPLPFSSGRTVFFESLAKAPIPAFMLSAGSLLLLVMQPTHASVCLAGLILGLALYVEIVGAILLAVVLFPDFTDPSQRALSGIVMMIAVVGCSSPGLGAFLLLKIIGGVPLLVAAIPSAAILIGVAIGISALSGTIYAHYNPSE